MPRRTIKSVCSYWIGSIGANVMGCRHCETSTMNAGGAALRYHTRSSHARLHAMATSPRIAALISSSSRR